MKRTAATAAIFMLIALGAAVAQPQPNRGAAEPYTVEAKGYLSPAQIPDSAGVLGPAPADGSGTKKGDVATFKATRKLEGTPRWTLAQSDAEFGPKALLREYSCAAGAALTPDSAPALLHMLSRLVEDSEAVVKSAKDQYRRPRPFVAHRGAICVAKEDWLKKSYSYPSGHSTFGWTAGLALSQAEPDRATQILARARSYGESRVVCGVHYESDVQAGRIAASSVFAAIAASPEYQTDLDAVRSELSALRANPQAAPDRQICSAEEQAAGSPVW